MKTFFKFFSGILMFMIIIGIVYASISTASLRKSSKLAWLGTAGPSSYDSAHNVGASYVAQSRFSEPIVGIILDSVSNLYWVKHYALYGIASSWAFSNDYCNNLTYGGYTDWRLPNIKELMSIVDESIGTRPSINTIYFPQTQFDYPYWSSTTYALSTAQALGVNFTNGKQTNYNKTDTCLIRCVR